MDGVFTEGSVVLEPKEEWRFDIRAKAMGRPEQENCTPGRASKLRGKTGWAATNFFGKCRRVGLAAVKNRQYDPKRRSNFTTELKEALRFLTVALLWAPPRVVKIVPPIVRQS